MDVLLPDEDHRRVGVCKGHMAPICTIDWSEDGEYMQTSDTALELFFWSMKTRQEKSASTAVPEFLAYSKPILLYKRHWHRMTSPLGWPWLACTPPAQRQWVSTRWIASFSTAQASGRWGSRPTPAALSSSFPTPCSSRRASRPLATIRPTRPASPKCAFPLAASSWCRWEAATAASFSGRCWRLPSTRTWTRRRGQVKRIRVTMTMTSLTVSAAPRNSLQAKRSHSTGATSTGLVCLSLGLLLDQPY